MMSIDKKKLCESISYLPESERTKIIDKSMDYDEEGDLTFELISNIITWIGVEFISEENITNAVKTFIGRDINSIEENIIYQYVKQLCHQASHNEKTPYTAIYIKDSFSLMGDLVALMSLSETTSIIDIKNMIRKKNSYYKDYNINLYYEKSSVVEYTELFNDYQCRAIINKIKIIYLSRGTKDPNHTVDKMKHLRSKVRFTRGKYHSIIYPNHYENYDYDRQLFKKMKYSPEHDAKVNAARKEYYKCRNEFETFMKMNKLSYDYVHI